MGKGKNEKKLVVNDNLVIDEDDLCEAIANKLALDEDIVFQVLDAEMRFFETKGLVVEEKSANAGQAENPTKSSPSQATQGVDRDDLAVDFREVIGYVIAHTGLNEEIARKVIDAEAMLLGGVK